MDAISIDFKGLSLENDLLRLAAIRLIKTVKGLDRTSYSIMLERAPSFDGVMFMPTTEYDYEARTTVEAYENCSPKSSWSVDGAGWMRYAKQDESFPSYVLCFEHESKHFTLIVW